MDPRGGSPGPWDPCGRRPCHPLSDAESPLLRTPRWAGVPLQTSQSPLLPVSDEDLSRASRQSLTPPRGPGAMGLCPAAGGGGGGQGDTRTHTHIHTLSLSLLLPWWQSLLAEGTSGLGCGPLCSTQAVDNREVEKNKTRCLSEQPPGWERGPERGTRGSLPLPAAPPALSLPPSRPRLRMTGGPGAPWGSPLEAHPQPLTVLHLPATEPGAALASPEGRIPGSGPVPGLSLLAPPSPAPPLLLGGHGLWQPLGPPAEEMRPTGKGDS